MIEANILEIKAQAHKIASDISDVELIVTLQALVKLGLLTRLYKVKQEYYKTLDDVPNTTLLEDLELVFQVPTTEEKTDAKV